MRFREILHEMLDLTGNRQLAAQVAVLAGQLPGAGNGGATPSGDVRQDLDCALTALHRHLATLTAKPSAERKIQWGSLPSPPEPPAPSAPPAPPAKKEEDWVMTAIDLTDILERAVSDEKVSAARSLSQAFSHMQSLLKQLGVERLDRTGEWEGEVQEVLDAAPAPVRDLDEQVAASVRAGYRFDGKLIRRQAVILYRWDGGTPSCN